MSRLKIIVLTIVAVLVVIVVLQNTDPVHTEILFVTITMPRAILLFVTLVAGFGIGIAVATHRKKKT
jgi:uncharacterized integral membrane protein